MTTIALPQPKNNSGILLFLALIIFAVAVGGALTMLSAEKHPESARIQAAWKNGLCSETPEVYFSETRGTVLVICKMEGEEFEAGGLIYRITEDLGRKFLTDPYLVTAFGATYYYWAENTVTRDGYILLEEGSEMLQYFLSLGL